MNGTKLFVCLFFKEKFFIQRLQSTTKLNVKKIPNEMEDYREKEKNYIPQIGSSTLKKILIFQPLDTSLNKRSGIDGSEY